MRIVGISGKIGSGKDYLTDELSMEMNNRKLVIARTSFAYPLKNEINEIIQLIRANRHFSYSELSVLISRVMSMSTNDAYMLVVGLYPEVVNDETLDGYSRTFGIRDSLQKHGTEIRRKQNPAYWTEKFLAYVASAKADIVFVSDARFLNEMDTVMDNGGYSMRINLPQDVLEKRRANRDGVIYTPEQLNHASETALDNYKRFSTSVGETFDTVKLVDEILNKV
jgi:hypothetical protein